MEIEDELDEVYRAGVRLPRSWVKRAPGEQLAAVRMELGVSQKQLAQEAGVDPSVVCRIEKGADARLSTWHRLFLALCCEASFALVPLGDEAEGLLQEERTARWVRAAAGREAGQIAAYWRKERPRRR